MNALPDSRFQDLIVQQIPGLRRYARALARLPIEQRQVVLLIGLEQLSYREAADALSVPIGTVMSRLARGRERLRALLDDAAQPRLHRIK